MERLLIALSFTFFVFGCGSVKKASEDDLVTQNRISENELILNCKGRGLDEYRARVDALLECQKAFSVFQNSQIEMNQIQYRSDSSQTNLSLVKVSTSLAGKKCQLISEKLISSADLVTLQISCRYQLNDPNDHLPASTLEELPEEPVNESYQIVKLVSYPKCDNVTIVGKKVRKIECIAASLVLELFPGDNLVVVEKDQFAPVKLTPNDFSGGMKIVRMVQY